MSIRFTAAQIDAPVLANPRFLERDLFTHLLETRPHLQACYPWRICNGSCATA